MINADVNICHFSRQLQLALRSLLASARLRVLVMSSELQVPLYLCLQDGRVTVMSYSLAVVTNQPAHFNAESARHAFPACSQVFAFSEANLHTRQAASN